MFLDFEKNVKKRLKRTCSFRGHLITPVFKHNYRKSVPVSHQHQTSCYVSLITHPEWITLGKWKLNYSDH